MKRFSLGSAEMDCLARANAKTANLTAVVLDLSKNWNPTGIYTYAEIEKMILWVGTIAKQALAQIATAPMSTSDIRQSIVSATNNVTRNLDDYKRFLKVMVNAPAGALFSAPDFKEWCTKTLISAVNAIDVALVAECFDSWDGWLLSYYEAFVGVASDIKQVAGQIYDVGKNIVGIPTAIADALKKILNVSLVAGGAYVAYQLFIKKEK